MRWFLQDIDTFVPDTFTTPTTARAARIHAPILEDIKDNPWLIVIWHEDPIHTYLWGGVSIYVA